MTAMRRSFTAVLEQGNSFSADFETEPFEAGWASEARWFVRILDTGGPASTLVIQTEVSPDGIVWCADETPPLHVLAASTPLATFARDSFGNWLRLRVRVEGTDRPVKLVIYLALKE